MKNAIITGATSGIGRELAELLSGRGYRVSLLARRGDLLGEVQPTLQARERECLVFECDVSDPAVVRHAVDRTIESWGPIDLAIANAGIGYPTFARKFVFEEARAIMRTNVEGTMTLFAATIPGMVERGMGRFVGVASLAGLRGLPGSSTYSASKAAMQAFLEASRVELLGTGVGVTIVNPGFIETPMTEKNRFPMPFLMKVSEAAEIIAEGIESGRREVNFPLPTVLMTRAIRLLPNAIFDRITGPFGKRKMDRSRYRR